MKPDNLIETFCLSVQSEMHPKQDTFETESEPIDHKQTLYLHSLTVACEPLANDCAQVEVLWREYVQGEVVDHPVDIPVWTRESVIRPYEKLFTCLDGTSMTGDGKSKLVIRRHVEGSVGPQTVAVVVRGYCH